jgi:Na+/H+-translocating membrane pyrophosphatase
MNKSTIGLILAFFGILLTEIIWIGLNPIFGAEFTFFCASISLGLYFIGVQIIVDSYVNMADNQALINEIKELSNKIDRLTKQNKFRLYRR